MKAEKTEPPMPDNPAPHIIRRLMEIGPVESNGMERVAISWREMDAWANRTKVRLRPWEASLIRRLSAEYLAEMRAAEDPYRPAPWSKKTVTVDDRQREEDRLRMVLG